MPQEGQRFRVIPGGGGEQGPEQLATAERLPLSISLIAQLETSTGNLGRELTEQEAAKVVEEVLTTDETSPTGYRFLKHPDTDEAAVCGDGRPNLWARIRYKMFGGDLHVNWEADELTDGFNLQTVKADLEKDGNKPTPIERAAGFMKKVMMDAHHRRAGAHKSSAHQHDGNCGCGAIDKHPQALAKIGEQNAMGPNNELVRLVSAAMAPPYAFDGDLHQHISAKAAKLATEETDTSYTGQGLMDALTDTVTRAGQKPEDTIEDLQGNHDELMLIINYTDMTLDRDAFVDKTGKQIFWIDALAIKAEAERYANTPAEAQRRYQAMMTMQVAKGLTLARTGLRVGVLKEDQATQPLAA